MLSLSVPALLRRKPARKITPGGVLAHHPGDTCTVYKYSIIENAHRFVAMLFEYNTRYHATGFNDYVATVSLIFLYRVKCFFWVKQYEALVVLSPMANGMKFCHQASDRGAGYGECDSVPKNDNSYAARTDSSLPALRL